MENACLHRFKPLSGWYVIIEVFDDIATISDKRCTIVQGSSVEELNKLIYKNFKNYRHGLLFQHNIISRF